MAQTVAELRAALAEAERIERAEAEERRKSVSPEYLFTVAFVDDKRVTWDRIRNDSQVRMISIRGEVVNIAALRAAGHCTDRLGGDMRYLVNYATETPKLICSTGGGNTYFDVDKQPEVVEQINAYLAAHEELDDNDITDIIEPARKARPRGW